MRTEVLSRRRVLAGFTKRSTRWHRPWRRCRRRVNQSELLNLSFEELRVALETMLSQQVVATRLPQLRDLERRFTAAGIGQIVPALGDVIPMDMAGQAIAHAWLQGVWSELILEDPQAGRLCGRGP